MKSLLRFGVLLCILHIDQSSYGQNSSPVNYLKTATQISFNKTAYNLAWSAHPTAQYYKQEYLPEGESLEKFNNMLLVEVLSSNMPLKDAVAAKIAELKTMKQSNPYISYESFYNKEKDEYVLDFVVTANSPDGKQINIAERNIYRYKKYTAPNGETGVLLFGVSQRSYGSNAASFIKALTPAVKKELVKKVVEFVMPEVKGVA